MYLPFSLGDWLFQVSPGLYSRRLRLVWGERDLDLERFQDDRWDTSEPAGDLERDREREAWYFLLAGIFSASGVSSMWRDVSFWLVRLVQLV